MAAALLDMSVPENLPPILDATAEELPVFDGSTRLYSSVSCPFAQRAWITRNYKGLQDQIKLVLLNLQSKPSWYKEKVSSANKVPALEHNGKVIVESLDVIKYIDSSFDGKSLSPNDPAKKTFFEELFSYTDKFNQIIFTAFGAHAPKDVDPAFDYLENALQKFDDGPFLVGQFSLVDIAYVPFVERFNIYLSGQYKYDFAAGRPKLAAWFEEMNKIDAYKQTKVDPKVVFEFFKSLFGAR